MHVHRRLSAVASSLAGPAAVAADTADHTADPAVVAPPSHWHSVPLLEAGCSSALSPTQQNQLDLDGHLVLSAVLTPATVKRAIAALAAVDELETAFAQTSLGKRKAEIQRLLGQEGLTKAEREPLQQEMNTWGVDGGHGLRMGIKQVTAEHNEYLESILGHPGTPPRHRSRVHRSTLARNPRVAHAEMLSLARSVLGEEIRFDHQCDSSGRNAGNPGMGYHSHAYANDDPAVGYIRIFFYLNGFALDDGNLKTVPGSHLFRDDTGGGASDSDIMEWAAGKLHPVTGEPLAIRKLECPPGSVVIMWTHATHGVDPKPAGSERRWALITAYRNPWRGAPMDVHDGGGMAPSGFPMWMTPRFRDAATPGLAREHKQWD